MSFGLDKSWKKLLHYLILTTTRGGKKPKTPNYCLSSSTQKTFQSDSGDQTKSTVEIKSIKSTQPPPIAAPQPPQPIKFSPQPHTYTKPTYQPEKLPPLATVPTTHKVQPLQPINFRPQPQQQLKKKKKKKKNPTTTTHKTTTTITIGITHFGA